MRTEGSLWAYGFS